MTHHDPDIPIPLPDVPAILRWDCGRHVTRQTVWNLARKGLSIPGGRARLQVLERGRRLYTTPRWLRWFLMEGWPVTRGNNAMPPARTTLDRLGIPIATHRELSDEEFARIADTYTDVRPCDRVPPMIGTADTQVRRLSRMCSWATASADISQPGAQGVLMLHRADMQDWNLIIPSC